MIGLLVRLGWSVALVASLSMTGLFLLYAAAAFPVWALLVSALTWGLLVRRFRAGRRTGPELDVDPGAARFSPTRTVGF